MAQSSISELVDVMIDEGIEVEDRYALYENISDAVAHGNIRAIMRGDIPIGFFTFRPIIKNDKVHIYIENMVVKREYRYPTNLLFLRRLFRKMYGGNFEFVYWHSQRHKTWTYIRPGLYK